MADPNSYSFDSQPENDFEKISAPGPGEGFDPNDGAAETGAGAGLTEAQDGEISTTTENTQGEDRPEEDRYNATGASSEADAFASSPDPLIALDDHDDDDEPRMQDPWQEESKVQPSAPVPEPENVEPLIDLGSFADQDTYGILTPSAVPPPSSSILPEPEPIPSNIKPPTPPIDDFNDFESQPKESESSGKQVSESEQSSDPVESPKGGCLLKGLDPRVVDLIYWKDVKKTGVVFGSMLVVLFSLAIFSLVSVLAYLSLALLTVTFSFVIYKKIMSAVQKSNEGHPFKALLEMDITLNEEKLKTVIQTLLNNLNKTICELRRLFLIEDIVDSIKFGLLLWVFTYIGCLLNGMSLIILNVILLFTLPKVYETYQVQIDNYIGLAKAQINNVLEIVQSKVPFLKKKEKAQ